MAITILAVILYRGEKTTPEERGKEEKPILRGKMKPEIEAAVECMAEWDRTEEIVFFNDMLNQTEA